MNTTILNKSSSSTWVGGCFFFHQSIFCSNIFFVDSYENAKFLCDQYYLTAPEVKITSLNATGRIIIIIIIDLLTYLVLQYKLYLLKELKKLIEK